MEVRMILRIEFELGCNGRNSLMDEKWIRGTADRIRNDVESRKLKDEKFLETLKLKQNHAPTVWRELKDWLRKSCADLNKEFGSEVVRLSELSGNEVTLTGKADGMYTTTIVTNDQQRLTISYSSANGDPSAKFEIGIRQDGSSGLSPERSLGEVRTVAEVGKEILHYATQVSRH
jgi:hypothetical protein